MCFFSLTEHFRMCDFLSVKGTSKLLSAVYRAQTWPECTSVCVSFLFFFLLSVNDRLAAQVNIWPNLCAGGWSTQREESLCHCTCFLLNKSLLYSQPRLASFFFPGDWCITWSGAKAWWLGIVLLICRNDHGIDNISNKLIIKGFPVRVVIFSEMVLCSLSVIQLTRNYLVVS